MRHTNELESRLTGWGAEYGGGRYEDHGWQGISPLATMMKYHGRPPQGLNPRRIGTNTPADEVERAVRVLESQRTGFIPGSVLRAEYFLPGQPVDSKRQKLARLGMQMDNTRYSQHLRIARIHVAGWLHLTFSDPLEVDQVIDMLEYVSGA